MLIDFDFRLEYGNRNLGLTRDVLELGEYLADCHFTSIRLASVIRPAEQNADEIRYRSVLAENTIDGGIARWRVQGT
jgi:hypothetical protein